VLEQRRRRHPDSDTLRQPPVGRIPADFAVETFNGGFIVDHQQLDGLVQRTFDAPRDHRRQVCPRLPGNEECPRYFLPITSRMNGTVVAVEPTSGENITPSATTHTDAIPIIPTFTLRRVS